MVRLVGIPGPSHTDDLDPVQWINPESITSLIPFFGPKEIPSLVVEIKLVGYPTYRAHFGTFDSDEAARTRWQQFLQELGAV